MSSVTPGSAARWHAGSPRATWGSKFGWRGHGSGGTRRCCGARACDATGCGKGVMGGAGQGATGGPRTWRGPCPDLRLAPAPGGGPAARRALFCRGAYAAEERRRRGSGLGSGGRDTSIPYWASACHGAQGPGPPRHASRGSVQHLGLLPGINCRTIMGRGCRRLAGGVAAPCHGGGSWAVLVGSVLLGGISHCSGVVGV